MITHHFKKDDEFVLSGYYADDYGKQLCSWTWNGAAIKVTAAGKMRPVDVSEFKVAKLSDEELRKRLIDIAKSTAEDLRGEPFE